MLRKYFDSKGVFQPKPVKGFRNYPNSCFLNAIVHMLLNTRIFLQGLSFDSVLAQTLQSLYSAYTKPDSSIIDAHQVKQVLNRFYNNQYSDESIYDCMETFHSMLFILDEQIRKRFLIRIIQNIKNQQTQRITQHFSLLVSPSCFENCLPVHHQVCQLMESESSRKEYMPEFLFLEIPRGADLESKNLKICHFAPLFQINSTVYELNTVLYHKGIGKDGHYTAKLRIGNKYYYIDEASVEQRLLEDRSATVSALLYEKN